MLEIAQSSSVSYAVGERRGRERENSTVTFVITDECVKARQCVLRR
jgi:hypothetical protein